MRQILITDRLHKKIAGNSSARLLTLRPLSKREIRLARKNKLGRYVNSVLSKSATAGFYHEFDGFWDKLITGFDTRHAFWRNVVSSKMQEWERSAAYLALSLYALAATKTDALDSVIIVCASVEEEDVCAQWCKKRDIPFARKPYLSPLILRHFLQKLGNLKNYFILLAKCIYIKLHTSAFSAGNLPRKIDVLIASLFYAGSFREHTYQDPFFGGIHETIRKKGRCCVYLSGPLGNYKAASKKVKARGADDVILPFSMISWGPLISAAFRVLTRKLEFSGAYFMGCDFSRLFEWNARRFDFFFNMDAEIFYLAVKKICQSSRIGKMLILYEGNVFERGCIQAVRRFSVATVTGYSHAVVFPLNLKLRLTDREHRYKPEPDTILATGPETVRLLETVGNRKNSNVYSACSQRFIPSFEFGASDIRRVEILVALDGVWGTVSVLDWILERSEILKDYRVNLRGHPNVPVDTLLKQCLFAKPDNFTVSHRSLEDDLANCLCVLYRQTSVGLQAIMNGVPAIHLAVDAPLVCDPVADLTTFKWTVRSSAQLSQALREINAIAADKREAAMKKSGEYAAQYFAPPDKAKTHLFYNRSAVMSQ